MLAFLIQDLWRTVRFHAASSLAGALLALSVSHPARGEEGSIEEYYITCDPDSFAYIYENWKRDHYIPVHFTHRGRTWRDTEMRIRGDSSRELPKKSLKIRFPSRPFHDGNERLNFNAEYLDPSYLRTVLASRLFRDTRHPAFLAEHARLFLNGNFLGLYVRVENMDAHFLNRNGLHPGGNLYKATLDGACLSTMDNVDHHWEKKTNGSGSRDDLRNLIFLLNTVPDREYLNFSRSYFTYDGMVNIIALNMLLANGSTYYHNYYMFHDTMGTGRWTMFPWDTDRTFSRYGWNLPYHRSGQPRHLHRWDNPFLERALQEDGIFMDIRSRLRQLSLTHFSPNHLFPIMDSLEVLLESTIPLDVADDVADVARWKAQIAAERSYITERHSRLERQMQDWPSPFRTLPLRWNGDVPWLTWQSAHRASTYNLKYAKDPRFSDGDVRIEQGLTDTVYALPPGLVAGRYFWNVEATNSHGSMEAFDSRSTFVLPRRRGGTAGGMVVINELNYHSADHFDPGDWVELYNPNARSLDLSGWYVKDGREDHVFFLPRSTSIVGRGYLVLCQEKDDFLAHFPRVEACVGGWDFGLGRYAESLSVFDARGTLVDSVTYGSDPPWPPGADGTGSTLQLIDPGLDNTLPANWGISVPYGTPGGSNAPLLLDPGVLRSYPNPFDRLATITFLLPEGARCNVAILDVRGSEVATLVDEWRPPGLQHVEWNGTDGKGQPVASGLYVARLKLGPAGVKTSKVVLLR